MRLALVLVVLLSFKPCQICLSKSALAFPVPYYLIGLLVRSYGTMLPTTSQCAQEMRIKLPSPSSEKRTYEYTGGNVSKLTADLSSYNI
jgi:hypothetical protein